MSRIRQFSLVFHNVKDDCKESAEAYFKDLGYEKFLQALEPYPESEGYHLHVFVTFKNPRRFKGFIKQLEQFSKNIVAPKPEGCETAWGRVQVDQMYGSFDQATAYLRGETKDKPVDSDIEVKDAVLERRMERYVQAIQQYHTAYYFIQYGELLTIEEFVSRAERDGLKVDPYYKKLQEVVNFSMN